MCLEHFHIFFFNSSGGTSKAALKPEVPLSNERIQLISEEFRRLAEDR